MTQAITNEIENYVKLKSMDFHEWATKRAISTKSGYIVDGLPIGIELLYRLYEQEQSGEVFAVIAKAIPKLCKYDLKDVNRERENLIPRQISMSLMFCFSTMSLKEVGKVFSKDHATVIHALKCVDSAYSCRDILVMPMLKKIFPVLYKKFQNIAALTPQQNIDATQKIELIQSRINKYEFSKQLANYTDGQNLTTERMQIASV